MAAPLFYLRFSFLKSSNKIFHSNLQHRFVECNPYQLWQHFLSQQQTFSNSSSPLQTSYVEGLPGYNYGLPGKGKSRTRTSKGHKWHPDVNGELLFGLHPVYLALTAKRRNTIYCLHIHEKYGKGSRKEHPMQNQIIHLASENEIPIKFVSKRDLDALSGNRPHQGICLDAEELSCMSWDRSIVPDMNSQDPPLWLLLHNIQDPMNFGAILRSSFFLGIERVLVPKDNSCKLSPVVSKASSGVLEVIDLLKLPQDISVESFCQWWKSHNGMVLGTHSPPTGSDNDDDTKCVALQNFTLSRPSLLVLGNEGTGLSNDIARLCDIRLYIQSHQIGYQKEIDSLNVSVATGIFLHWLQMSKLKSS